MPSTEYNHPLAQWAMKLAYATYKPLKGQFSDIAPGKFMEPDIRSAQEELDDYGFESSIYNDGDNDTVCHVIGHKQIYANINNSTNGGNNNGTLGIFEGTTKCRSTGVIYGSNQSGLRTDVSMDSTGMSCVGSSEAFWNTLNSDDANNTDFMIKTNTNTNGGNDNGSLGSFEKTIGSESAGVLNFDSQSNLWADDFVGTVGSNCTGNSEIFGNTLNSDNTNCMRTLVVVDIRGTSTNRDWVTDIGTQINPDWGSFDAGMEIVLKSLYHGTGDTENCTKCNGGGCEHCKGYIPYNNISNPIFLVTGHSLGAAVANLLAEHLNSCKDTNHCPGSRTEKDIYSYTFATPKQYF